MYECNTQRLGYKGVQDTFLVQDGYEKSEDGKRLIPKFKTMPNRNSRDCKYDRCQIDPKCAGCESEKHYPEVTEKTNIENDFKDYVPYSTRMALERSTPLKPNVVKDALGIRRFFCGRCDGKIDDVTHIYLTGKFCCLCGQKIDWQKVDLRKI